MKKRFFLVFLLFISSYILWAQNPLEIENLREISMNQPDSSALANNIKSIQIYNKEKQNVKRLISHTDFDSKGRIKKLIDYNYLLPKDSIIVTVLENNEKNFDVQTKIKPTQFYKRFEYRNDLMFGWPEYRDILDTVSSVGFYFIRKSYNLGDDSLITVSTFVNNKKIETKSFLNPFFKGSGNDEDPYKKIKYDSTFNGDTLVKFSRIKTYDGDSLIWRMYQLKDKILKEENWLYGNRISGYTVSIWKYDLLGRVIFFEQSVQDKDGLYPIAINVFIYNKDGTRIETDDTKAIDGHIGQLDELRKYDRANKLTNLIRYQYAYGKTDKYELFRKVEYIYKYNLKGLIAMQTFYINGTFQKQREYIYKYY